MICIYETFPNICCGQSIVFKSYTSVCNKWLVWSSVIVNNAIKIHWESLARYRSVSHPIKNIPNKIPATTYMKKNMSMSLAGQPAGRVIHFSRIPVTLLRHHSKKHKVADMMKWRKKGKRLQLSRPCQLSQIEEDRKR